MANEYALGLIDQKTGQIVPLFFVTEEPLGNGQSVITAATNADYVEYHKAQGDEEKAMKTAATLLESLSGTLGAYAQQIQKQQAGEE